MWFVVVYLVTVLIYLGCAAYDIYKHRETLPPFILPMALIALVPAINTIVLVGLAISIAMEKRK